MLQPSDDPVFVEAWEAHEDFGIFPTGSKPKQLLICPSDAPQPYLIPGRAYMLKSPSGWRAQQVWSEVIAYRVSHIVGVNVPPCHIALDKDGKLGALIEFFYEYPRAKQTTRLIHGADLLNLVRRPTDGVRPHDIATNIRAFRALRLPLRSAIDWWARTVAFDSLIGNTDRHTENWGAIQLSIEDSHFYDFAPVYDNGTSLGYQQREERLAGFWQDPKLMERFIDDGCHDCGISPDRDGPMPHMHLCTSLLDEYPAAGDAMRTVIRITREQIAQIVDDCVAFRVGARFTPERAYFVASQMEARLLRLQKLLGATP